MGCCSSNNSEVEGGKSGATGRNTQSPYLNPSYSQVDSYGNDPSMSADDRQMSMGSDREDNMDESEKEIALTSWKQAVMDGNHTLMEYYMTEYPDIDLVNTEMDDGASGLEYCILHEHRVAAALLIKSRANINHINRKTGDTPLHAVAKTEDIKIGTMLLALPHLNRRLKNKKRRTAYDEACRQTNDEMIELLMPEELKQPKITEDEDAPLQGDFDDDVFAAQFVDDDDTSGIIVSTKDTFVMDHQNSSRLSEVDDMTPTEVVDGKDSETPTRSNTLTHEAQTRQDVHATKAFIKTLRKQVAPATGSNNPFNRRIKRKATQKILDDMSVLRNKQSELPKLEAWLEKKMPRAPYSWQKRWVIVRDQHMLWSDKQRSLDDGNDPKERAKFNGQLDVLSIKEIIPIKTTSQNKFAIIALNPKKKKTRRYEWKAATTVDRNFWLEGIQKHQKYLQEMVKYLEENQ